MDGQYKYAYIKEKNGIFRVVFYNDINNVKIDKHEMLVHNVYFYTDGEMLYLEGLEDEVHWTEDRIDINNLKYKVREKDIKHYDGFKLIGLKPFDYVYGWYAYEAKNNVNYTFKNYAIKIINDK